MIPNIPDRSTRLSSVPFERLKGRIRNVSLDSYTHYKTHKRGHGSCHAQGTEVQSSVCRINQAPRGNNFPMSGYKSTKKDMTRNVCLLVSKVVSSLA